MSVLTVEETPPVGLYESRFASIAVKLADEEDFLANVLLPLSAVSGTECVYKEFASFSSPEYLAIVQSVVNLIQASPSIDIAVAGSNQRIAARFVDDVVGAMSDETLAKVIKHNKDTLWLQFDDSDIRKLWVWSRSPVHFWRGISPNVLFVVAECLAAPAVQK